MVLFLTIDIDQTTKEVLEVLSFESTDFSFGLSGLRLRVLSKNIIPLENCIHKKARLPFFRGLMMTIKGPFDHLRGPVYECELYEALGDLILRQPEKAFVTQSLPQIILSLLKNSQYFFHPAYVEFAISEPLKTAQCNHYFGSEYDNYLCLLALCNAYALDYKYQKNRIIFYDSFEKIEVNKCSINFSNNNTVLSVNINYRLKTEVCLQSQYQFESPRRVQKRVFRNQTSIPAKGIWHLMEQGVGHRYFKTQEAQREVLSITLKGFTLEKGDLLELSEHPVEDYNGTFRVFKVIFKAGHSVIRCVRLKYCPSILSQERHFRPLSLLESGKIAQLDNNGEYSFFYREKSVSAISTAKAIQHFYASHRSAGFHFPHSVGSQILIGQFGYRQKQPLIVGGFFENQLQTTEKQTLLTPKKQSLTLVDEKEDKKICFNQPEKNQLALISNPETSKIKVQTAGHLNVVSNNIEIQGEELYYFFLGNFVAAHHSCLNMKIAEQANFHVCGEMTLAAMEGINLRVEEGNMQFNTHEKANFYAKALDWTMKESTGSFNVHEGMYALQAEERIFLETHQGCLELKTPGGKIVLNKENIIIESTNEILFESQESTFIEGKQKF